MMARLGRDLKGARQWTRREYRAGEVLDPTRCAGGFPGSNNSVD